MYKLAIFDFDGTLVDSAPGIVEVMRQCMVEYAFEETILDQWRHLIGVPLAKQMETILPDHPPETHAEVVARYREIYDSKAVEICPPFPGLLTMLEMLKGAGVHLTIASSKRRHLIDSVLDHHMISDRFSIVVGAQEVLNHKPHPESVHYILERLPFLAHEAVVIGDSSYDLDMARSAGVDCIGVTTGIHTADILALSKPNHIVTSLEEVVPIILNGRKRQS